MWQDKCRGAKSGGTAISIPQTPSQAPNRSKNLIFMDNQKMELPNSMVPLRTTPPVVLTSTLFSQRAGSTLFLCLLLTQLYLHSAVKIK